MSQSSTTDVDRLVDKLGLGVAMDKKLHVEEYRVDWSDHSDAMIAGPFLEERVTRIREVLLDMNRGKLTMFACLQVIAMEVFTQAEISEYSAAEQLHQADADGKCPECGYAHAPGGNTCCSR